MNTTEVTLTLIIEWEEGDDPGMIAQNICDTLPKEFSNVRSAEWDYEDDDNN